MTISTTLSATYRGGVLVPEYPLPLGDGESVQVTVTPMATTEHPTDEEVVRRMTAAKSVQELFAAYAAAPSAPEDYDLIQALDENRRHNGERPLYPCPEPEIAR